MWKIRLALLFLLLTGCVFIPQPSVEPTRTSPPPTAEVTSTATTTPAPTLTVTTTPLPLDDIAYFHLRLVYSTTSDWSTLEFGDTAFILSSRLVELSGAPDTYSAGMSGLSLNQPIANAENNLSVGMTVDLALATDAAGQVLPLTVKKGDLGASQVSLYQITEEEEPLLLQTVTHDQWIGDGTGTNPLPVSFDLATLQDSAPLTAASGAGGLQKMVWAFYYPWYRMSDWSSSILMDHPLQAYDSAARRTIEQHIAQAQGAGIDGFISSWWGPYSDTNRNLKTLLDVAEEAGFYVCVYFETLAEEGPLPEEEIFEWLEYLISTYRAHPAYMKVEGKPLVVVWVSGTVPLESWQRIFTDLRAEGYDAVYLAMGYDSSSLEVFDGYHEYGIFGFPDLDATMAGAGRTARYYSLLDPLHSHKIWAATVQPGYDDRTIPGREGFYQERENGAFYRRTWEAALASDPDWVFITTWNEWWEHTHIEPSENFGELYLDITREYAGRWKNE